MIVCPWKELKRYAAILPGVEEAIEKIDALQSWEPAVYPLENGKFIVQQGTTRPWKEAKLEAHRAYLDVQVILEGKDTVGWAPVDTLSPDGEFDIENDYCLYTGENTPIEVKAGYCYVVFPEDAHAPNTHLSVPSDYKKIVVKLKL